MREIEKTIARCQEVCANPKAQLDRFIAQGKKVVGVMPYFCPEELVHAAGMVPFGLWGAQMQASESKRYFPAFICSILHTTLEMGLRGELNDLSAIMIPISCDSLKGMGANWEYGVKTVPVINVAYAQNRKIAAGVEFTASQLRKIKKQLEGIAGAEISDGAIAASVAAFNDNRATLLAFTKAAGEHPELVSSVQRSAVIKAGYFMDKAEHTALVREITEALEAAPKSTWKGLRVVTTGIIADSAQLLEIFRENNIAIVADQVAHESVNLRYPTPVTDDPIVGMAQRLGNIEGCSVLYDLGKVRGTQLVELAKENHADGIIWVMTKFCDPEEYDYVPVKRMIDAAGIPVLSVEVDQQMVNFEQARSAVQAFAEMIG
jgi:benzoyl-CoA reductase/2-hydroxyglutaryl-CoA dehydratase subunit BcrC/BadD/HgdB